MVTVESTTANFTELFRGGGFESRRRQSAQNDRETICRRLVVADSSGRVRSDSILHPAKKIKAKSQIMCSKIHDWQFTWLQMVQKEYRVRESNPCLPGESQLS